MQQKASSHQSLERALKILLAFEQRNEELGPVEISKKTDIHRSTISRITKILVAYDFLEQNPRNGKVSLGQANIRLSRSLKRSLKTSLVEIAKPYIDELRDKLEETIFLENLVGNNWVMAYVAESDGPFRLVAEVGERMLIHAASGGKTFLAYADSELRDSLLTSNLSALTDNTITDRLKLERDFEQIRKNGYSFDKEEYSDGVHAIGIPIFSYQNQPVASLVVAGLAPNISGEPDSRVVVELKKTAETINHRLGFRERG